MLVSLEPVVRSFVHRLANRKDAQAPRHRRPWTIKIAPLSEYPQEMAVVLQNARGPF